MRHPEFYAGRPAPYARGPSWRSMQRCRRRLLLTGKLEKRFGGINRAAVDRDGQLEVNRFNERVAKPLNEAGTGDQIGVRVRIPEQITAAEWSLP